MLVLAHVSRCQDSGCGGCNLGILSDKFIFLELAAVFSVGNVTLLSPRRYSASFETCAAPLCLILKQILPVGPVFILRVRLT